MVLRLLKCYNNIIYTYKYTVNPSCYPRRLSQLIFFILMYVGYLLAAHTEGNLFIGAVTPCTMTKTSPFSHRLGDIQFFLFYAV